MYGIIIISYYVDRAIHVLLHLKLIHAAIFIVSMQGYPPATYPQQSSLPTQQQQIPQPSEPLPPMITEDTV